MDQIAKVRRNSKTPIRLACLVNVNLFVAFVHRNTFEHRQDMLHTHRYEIFTYL
jgi:hypothetical protein